MHNPVDSLDAAQTCAAQLHAIEDLFVQASAGNRTLDQVNPDHLAQLLSGILEDMDTALVELARHVCRPRPHLHTF